MRVMVVLVGVLVLFPWSEPVEAKRRHKAKPQYVILDGDRTRVNWNDGDSFRVLRGPRKDTKARLMGYNTLESYGPVHFWGGFTAWQLSDMAKEGTRFAKTSEWDCESEGKQDRYGRILVNCPELTKGILAAGLAHVFTVGADADPEHLAIQLEAQNKRRGIWKWGIPARIVSSIHSGDEHPEDPSWRPYNRVCDTRTGKSWTIPHTETYRPCAAWCNGGSCMVYVPFKVRYGSDRPACLRQGSKSRLVLPAHLEPSGSGL